MTESKDYVLALVAETKTDEKRLNYVSEGLVAAISNLQNTPEKQRKVVISSDVFGPTWFNKTTEFFNSGLRLAKGHLSKDAVMRSVYRDIEGVREHIIDPSWRLTETAAEELCDFTFLKQAPLLNLLNAFENIMDGVFRSAANLVLYSTRGDTNEPSWVIDSEMLANRNNSTVADLAMGRAKRAIALFLGYTLCDILRWKQSIASRMKERGLDPFAAMPPHLEYGRAADMIEKRIKDFIEGSFSDGVTVSEEDGQSYVVPTISTVLTNMVSVIQEGFYPPKVGSFHEALLGREIMVLLSAAIDAEYRAVLSRTRNAKPNPLTTKLDKYVNNPHLQMPSESVTEREKEWVERERERIKTTDMTAENLFRDHPYLPKAIDGILGPKRTPTALQALQREYKRCNKFNDIVSPETLEYFLVNNRQVMFSNYSVTRVLDPDSAARFSMYVLWNALFLCSGGLTQKTNSSAVKSRLILQVFLKDMHSLFVCQRCESGFITKSLDTFTISLKEQSKPSMGEQELETYWKAVLDALGGGGGNNKGAENVNGLGELMVEILSTDSGLLRGGGLGGDIGFEGKMKQKREDEEVRNMHLVDKKGYVFEAAKYVHVSKGFAALSFYLLYAAAATSNPSITNNFDRAVYLLLARWGDLKFPTHNLWGNVPTDENTSSLLSFASFWALRNAVRARRNVIDASNTSFVPGRPLPLLSAFSSKMLVDNMLKNNYVKVENVNREKLIWKAFREMQTESEIWKTSGSKAASDRNVKKAKQDLIRNASIGRLIVEPVGKTPISSIALFRSMKRSRSEDLKMGSNNKYRLARDTKTATPRNPLSYTGKIVFSLDDLKNFSKDSYTTMKVFPLTPLDG
nr:MAG: envelope protein VP90 [White spot syndrome virus]